MPMHAWVINAHPGRPADIQQFPVDSQERSAVWLVRSQEWRCTVRSAESYFRADHYVPKAVIGDIVELLLRTRDAPK